MFRLLLERKWLGKKMSVVVILHLRMRFFSDSLKDENRMKAAECGNRKRL